MSEIVALAIGAVSGGPGSDAAWLDAVTGLGRKVRDLRQGVVSPIAVNVVYQIPGRNLSPDFEGVRTGRYSRREGRLMVQVALPTTTHLNHAEVVRDFLESAIALAEEFAKDRRLTDQPLHELRSLLGRVSQAH